MTLDAAEERTGPLTEGLAQRGEEAVVCGDDVALVVQAQLISAGAVSSVRFWSGRSTRFTVNDFDAAELLQALHEGEDISTSAGGTSSGPLPFRSVRARSWRPSPARRSGGCVLLELLGLVIDIGGEHRHRGLLQRLLLIGQRERDDDRLIVAIHAGAGVVIALQAERGRAAQRLVGLEQRVVILAGNAHAELAGRLPLRRLVER